MQHLTAFNNGEQSKPFRDKVAKTLQYFSKVIAETSTDPETKKTFSTLSSNLSMGRRIYRWGQVSNSIENIIKLITDKKSNKFIRKLALYLAYFFSQSYDMICYIHMIRFNQKGAERSSWFAQLFYFIVCVLELWEVLIPLTYSVSNYLRAKREEDKRKELNNIIDGILNASKRIGDGITALRDVIPERFEEHKVGVAASGFISGAISIYQSVPSLYKKY